MINMKANNLTKIAAVTTLVSVVGIAALNTVETNIPFVGLVLGYLATMAIFGLAAFEGSQKRKRLS